MTESLGGSKRPTVLYIFIYYIDRCELWGFSREINLCISHVKYQFFPVELLLHNYKCGGYVPCCVTVNTHTIVNWTNSTKCHWRIWHITNMTYIIDIIWRLPVWNVKNRRYLASCTLQFWSNLTKISFQGKHFTYFCILL